MKRVRSNSVRRRWAALVPVVGMLAVVGRGDAQSPLPALQTRVLPVLHILIDTSGSMSECDGGLIDHPNDLTLDPSTGKFLFDPTASDSDDGDCKSTPDLTYSKRSDAKSGIPSSYNISRMEAVKLALSKVLDADGNGTINSADEQALRIKIGLSRFSGSGTYRTDTASVKPIGSSYGTVWTTTLGFVPSGGTPSGPALAGTRALSIQNCYDGSLATFCDLGAGQTDAVGNDKAIGCRDYYVMFMTDGEPNGGAGGTNPAGTSSVVEDPISIAKQLHAKGKTHSGETVPALTPSIRTIGIGFGADVIGSGSYKRGVINCMSFMGGGGTLATPAMAGATDANIDNDDDPKTMDIDTDGGTLGVNVTCSGYANQSGIKAGDFTFVTTAENFYGNGYTAANARDLQNTFRRILNAIQAGTYSRSEPTINAGSTTTYSGVFSASFEVPRDGNDWRGTLKKFYYRPTDPDGAGPLTSGYADCNNPSNLSNPPVPCWDSGEKLEKRDYTTRVYYLADVQGNGFKWEDDLKKTDARIGWTSKDNARPNITVRNVVPDLVPLALTSSLLPSTGSRLYQWAKISTLKDSTHTWPLGTSTGTIPSQSISETVQALAFAVGRPDSTFADGTPRCGKLVCLPTDDSPKQGDSYSSRAVIVGPPVGLVSDPDYIGEFRSRVLAPYSGDEEVKLRSDTLTSPYAPVSTSPFVTASPCPAGVSPCTVTQRRTVVYLPANDGALHAFDEETGEELWAFVPPSHMWRLYLQRTGRTAYIDAVATIRDVKFPCERSSGTCAPASSDAFEDGKWHTMLFLGNGTGGAFFFAVDITNPVAPVFLWEYRDGDKMGFTLAPVTVAEIPTDSSGLTTRSAPGSAVFATGGFFNDPSKEPHVYSLQSYNGQRLQSRKTPVVDLDTAWTNPGGLQNGLIGAMRPVDGNLDGDVDRIYFGDREGRVWKACKIRENGDFDLKHFFDPSTYDRTNGNPTGYVGQPVSALDKPTNTLADSDGRMRLRGPIYFAPDATRNASNELIVTFGSGNLLDPLSPPQSYYNLVWAVTDDASLDSDSCLPAKRNVCTSTGRTLTVVYKSGGGGGKGGEGEGEGEGPPPGSPSVTFSNVLPIGRPAPDPADSPGLLSSAPFIFNKYLFYSEFEPDPDKNVCSDDYLSRVVAKQVFDCATPAAGTGPFSVGGVQTSEKVYANQLVTGVEVNPRTGAIFVQTSTPGNNPPQVLQAPGIAVQPAFAGWKQRN